MTLTSSLRFMVLGTLLAASTAFAQQTSDPAANSGDPTGRTLDQRGMTFENGNDANGSGTVAPSTSSGSSVQSSDQSAQGVWSKDDAIRNRVTEAQFNSADTNGDGALDPHEREAAGLRPR